MLVLVFSRISKLCDVNFRLCVRRRIVTVMKWMAGQGYNVEKVWDDIDDVITKTLISAHSVLKHNYRTCFPNHVRGSACFEILGFDIMLDKKLKPYILEVQAYSLCASSCDVLTVFAIT